METFGDWLRQQRTDLKLTREQFAERVGCSVALLRKIEDGERRPSIQIAELIANTLNIPEADRATFVRVARGELNLVRLPARLKPVASPIVNPVQRINLPILPSPLIGRQREVEELSQLLRDPYCRLLTLVGPGGMGKTRLAIETAAQVQPLFPDGVYFVPLAPVSGTRFIVPMIADAIGFTFQGTSLIEPQLQLFNYLREKQALLVLDNLEHLLAEPGIEVLADLLAHAPYVKLLTTSRESLGLQGEWVFEVQGLPIPESRYLEGSTQNTSVELFLQRARRAHVGFQATAEDYAVIVRICQLVNGMPLGIELAAAWTRMLTCSEIAQEIERGLDFLSVSTRDLPARHRSMRAVFDHSWKLLTEEEQQVLLRLSVFRGGFRGEAAEPVAEAALSVLSMLVTKSLVRRGGDGRYDLHELIGQFASERFAEQMAEHAATQSRHGRYYLVLFSQAETRLQSSAQREALAELSAETDNFRTAWDWAVAHDEFILIAQVVRAISLFIDIRGWWQDGFAMLDSAIGALEIAGKTVPLDRTLHIALGHLLVYRGLFTWRLGQYEQAQSSLERSLDILRPLDEPRVLVSAITFLGSVTEFTGNYDRAVTLYAEGLEIATVIGDRWFAALCRVCHIGLLSITQAVIAPEVAHERFQSAVAEWRTIGDPRMTAIALNTFGWNALALGLFGEARAALEESVALSQPVNDRWGLGFAYRGLGIVAQVQGDQVQAVDMFRLSLDTLTELGSRHDAARILAEMSRSLLALGDDAAAERGWHEALRVATEIQEWFVALEALTGMATLQVKRGESEQALAVVSIVLNHPASLQATKDRADQLRAELVAHMTNEQVEAVKARAQTFEAVVSGILNQPKLG